MNGSATQLRCWSTLTRGRTNDQGYVFCACDPEEVPAGLQAVMVFQESESTTLVIPSAQAEAEGLTGEFPCQWITLGVASDLSAVGFLAAVTAGLASAGISANAVSAFHHDHLFVPAGEGGRAVEVLRALQSRHSGPTSA
jgi:uncharacterized protein